METKNKMYWDKVFYYVDNIISLLKGGMSLDELDKELDFLSDMNYDPMPIIMNNVRHEIESNLENMISTDEQRTYLKRLDNEFKNRFMVLHPYFKPHKGCNSLTEDYLHAACSYYSDMFIFVRQSLNKLNGINEHFSYWDALMEVKHLPKAAGEPNAEAVADSPTMSTGEPEKEKKHRSEDSYNIKTTKLWENCPDKIDGKLMHLMGDLVDNLVFYQDSDWKILAWLLMGNNMVGLNKPRGKLKCRSVEKYSCFIDRLEANGLIKKDGKWVTASYWVDSTSDSLKAANFNYNKASTRENLDNIIRKYFKI